MNLWKNNAPKIYLASVAVQAILSLVLLAAIKQGDWYIYLSYLVPQIANVVVIAVACRLQKTPLKETIPCRGKLRLPLLLLTLPLAVGLYCHNLLFAGLFEWLMEALGVPMSVTMPAGNAWWNILLSIVVLCVLPAVGEEAMFRGVLPKTFEKRGILSTVFLSALAFALAHGNAAQLIHQFILAAVLVYLTRKTDNLTYAVAIHFFNNLIAVICNWVLPAGALAEATLQNVGILFGLFGAGIVILYPTLFAFLSLNAHAKPREVLQKERAKEVFWFDDPERAGEKISLWEFGMWAFLVILSVGSTVLDLVG